MSHLCLLIPSSVSPEWWLKLCLSSTAFNPWRTPPPPFFSRQVDSEGAENSLYKELHSFCFITHTQAHAHTLLISINPLATLISTFCYQKLPRAPYISAVFNFLACSSFLPRETLPHSFLHRSPLAGLVMGIKG